MSCTAQSFAEHLDKSRALIHAVLQKCQSWEVVNYEINKSIETLNSISENEKYFSGKVKTISVFLPLNLPLYSFVLFAGIPSYQSEKVHFRPPERLINVFTELYQALHLNDFYPNVHLYEGNRQNFIDIYCKKSNVVIFTGKYENFLKIKEICNEDTLILFNGVGHNPIVITETADIDLAVEKTIHVKLFNNGQDCAGPDFILVHSNVIQNFIEKLTLKIKEINWASNYSNSDTKIGPLFERKALATFAELAAKILESGGEIVHGGSVDYKHNVIPPCIFRHSLKKYRNYQELYSPVFVIAEYSGDDELDLYFNDPEGKYIQKQMYVSVFGYSEYVAKKVSGSIPLINTVIHDIERGTEEYGGYGASASAVWFKGMLIPKPVLIPREIYTFILSPYKDVFDKVPHKHSDPEKYIVEMMFRNRVPQIFSDNLVFAYIFGSYATNKDKSYSDVDTFVCVAEKNEAQDKKYLEWIFEIAEIFGKIPDFKYPAEIVELRTLELAIKNFSSLSLAASENPSSAYDAMVWLHSLSHQKIGVINGDRIKNEWELLFMLESHRIVKSFMIDLRKNLLQNRKSSNLQSVPENESDIDIYIDNLGNGRKLVDLLKYIPFIERPLYSGEILETLSGRSFFGKKLFDFTNTKMLYDPSFRFGVVK